MWNLKKRHKLIYKTETITDVENKLTVTKGESRGKGYLGDWD